MRGCYNSHSYYFQYSSFLANIVIIFLIPYTQAMNESTSVLTAQHFGLSNLSPVHSWYQLICWVHCECLNTGNAAHYTHSLSSSDTRHLCIATYPSYLSWWSIRLWIQCWPVTSWRTDIIKGSKARPDCDAPCRLVRLKQELMWRKLFCSHSWAWVRVWTDSVP